MWNRVKSFGSSFLKGGESTKSRLLLATTSELQNGQMKEVALELEGRPFKVLLSRVEGKFCATSHLCPHYKARLVTGTLSSDGKVTCPWHAACFDVRTGDIEEAPSLKALKSFPVEVENENVYLLISMEDLGDESDRAVCEGAKVRADPANGTIVILGGGAAGGVAAESVRQSNFDGRLIMISREPHLPVDRIKLSKVMGVPVENLFLYKPEYYQALKVETIFSKSAIQVNFSENSVSLDDGETVSYDCLLVATGGEPRTLPIPGAGLGNIHVLRSFDDNQRISSAINTFNEKPRIVIVGSSFIGLEAAAMLCKKAESITVVGLENVPLERVLGPQVGAVFERLHRKNGIAFRLGAVTKAFIANEDDPQNVGSVELADGQVLSADMVILGVGVKMATEMLKGGPVQIGDDGGISVDEYMRIIGTDNVFAAGDIARFPYVKGGQGIRVEHWDVAQQQGRIAGRNMVASRKGTPMTPYKSLPFFFTMQYGKSVRYAGSTHEGYDDIFVTGDMESDTPSFAAYYMSNKSGFYKFMRSTVLIVL